MPKVKYIVVKLEDNALKNVGNIKFLLVFTFDVALSFIHSAWAVIGLHHHTKFENYILKFVDS